MRHLPLFQQLLDLSQDCVKQVTTQGDILAINGPGVALLRLHEEAALIGQSWVSLWPPQQQASVHRALAIATAGQRVHFIAASDLPGQGERWWSVSVGPLTEPDGRVSSLGVISREVTERVQLERSLETLNDTLRERLTRTRQQLDAATEERDAAARAASASSAFTLDLADRLDLAQMARDVAEQVAQQGHRGEAIGQLVVGMGHDFNNNLQTVLSALDAVPSMGELTPAQDRFLGFARSAAQHAALMSRRLMAFSRAHPVSPERLNLADVVTDLVPLLDAALGRGIVVGIDAPDEELMTFADAHSIQQSLTNLCMNARDACDGQGTISIRFGRQVVDAQASRIDLDEGAYVFVEVEDQGRGMDEEVREKLFQPFFSTKPSGTGSGLGMSQVLAAVRQAGGAIDVQTQPGQGTRVRLLFPSAPAFAVA